MQQNRSRIALVRLVASIVLGYGLTLIATSLVRQLRAHPGHDLDVLLLGVPQVIGMGFVYLGSLLFRRKYNAWLAALTLFGVQLTLSVVRVIIARDIDSLGRAVGFVLPLLIVVLLVLTHDAFQVRSDMRTFRRAVGISVLVLSLAFAYGAVGFVLLDRHDFQHNMTVLGAMHQTVDQFSLTTDHPVAHTRRARLFMDSLPVMSIAALGYVAVSFFDPIRMRFVNQAVSREKVQRLLQDYPSDIDDFFKLWPHDKLYFFDHSGEAGLAYHVTRGVALVVGDPFGNPKQFLLLCKSFQELCFVNDWRPAFIHVSTRHKALYDKLGFKLQKIGEEAILDLDTFAATKNDKYFRQIRNRFTKLGYEVELLEPPFDTVVLDRLQTISTSWLERPGRAERGFMLGSYSTEYMQQSQLAVVRDAEGQIRGFVNVVPTYESGAANYDLLRCDSDAPGNCNDFLLLGLIEALQQNGYHKLNLGLCPLKGLDEGTETTGIIDTALRFIYANGDRLYSFSGLQRFKAKYHPDWENRYVAYSGSPANFARTMTALTRAMKVR